jgi:hypothetical protein
VFDVVREFSESLPAVQVGAGVCVKGGCVSIYICVCVCVCDWG